MVARIIDTRQREEEILDLIIESYIEESRPVSSTHLCQKYRLPYSSATVRNIMESLEHKGYISHLHTSSGRVPTQKGFQYYVDRCVEKKLQAIKEKEVNNNRKDNKDKEIIEKSKKGNLIEVLEKTSEILANNTGYPALVTICGEDDERVMLKGARFILEQPEFEDVAKLRNLFYAIEVKMDQIHQFLSQYIENDLKILVGDEIGFEEISECSLVVSGIKAETICLALAVLGPMRMHYLRAIEALRQIRCNLEEVLDSLAE